jgi:hypothetical protein
MHNKNKHAHTHIKISANTRESLDPCPHHRCTTPITLNTCHCESEEKTNDDRHGDEEGAPPRGHDAGAGCGGAGRGARGMRGGAEVGQLTVCMPAITVGYEPYSLTRHSLYALTLETKYRNITV